MRLAQVLLVIGRTDEAEEVIDAAFAAHPEAAVIYPTQAELLLYRNDPERALAAALKATELDPNDRRRGSSSAVSTRPGSAWRS